jgi:hypothetical protein
VELILKRNIFSDVATFGELFIGDEFECFTLEDKVRIDDPETPENEGVKVMHETAIPAGVYSVILNFSPKFGHIMPRLLNVPGFDGILIHKGNTPENTWGCILVGRVKTKDAIYQSTPAFGQLFAKLSAATDRGEDITITITNEFPHANE